MKIDISSDAEIDLEEAFWFYERQATGLGAHFRKCISSDIESLGDYAGIHEKAYGYHRSLSKRFPYAIYYETDGRSVLIVAVLDQRRNPSWIERRLGS
jgi:plasmid stabilization system protein ParE